MRKHFLSLLVMTVMGLSAIAQTKVIAHRGAWKQNNLPHNSIASLLQASELKVWGSEFDVHITKDDVLVVNHDADFYGTDIATATLEELATKLHPNGEYIPTLEEFLNIGLQLKDLKLILELKSSGAGKERTIEATSMVIDLIKKLNAEQQVEIISFDYDACLKARELNATIPVHYLMGDKSPQQIKDAKLTGVDYHYSLFQKNPTWIQEFKALGLKTNAWTANKKEDIQFLIDQKIDFITTDEPELALKLVK
ncbi:glycerophosphodiester phosphodiesterase [Sphingobacterium corticibacter]|uniref:Glycerophosphodiester phosphodiesterase n=1 Tax=Sphingobacterium corticibacter TaxID=2171749 RepID=A0A2T8HJB8_9SPHI|nr:glycerophosphodiester phosphodiesterase family protein [Sphingobacterium corticibacter]PVH25493.1 glycerophosphodiester phosphodiesterase [Sphingobacterium corticibacter]